MKNFIKYVNQLIRELDRRCKHVNFDMVVEYKL
jgi:hypothetical protein